MQTVLQALTQQRKQTATTLKGQVCNMLGWTEEQYANFQYETGLEYLSLYTLNDEFVIDQLERSKIFWSWWKNAWANRDEVNVHNTTVLRLPTRLKLYEALHDALALAEELRPDAIVLGDSYKQMIGEVIKKEVANG